MKNLTTIITAVGMVLVTGGGATSMQSMSAKQDSTNEKLDKLVLSVTELRAEVSSGKEATGKLDAALLSLLARVSDLERRDAADHERISEHDRRLNALEGKGK